MIDVDPEAFLAAERLRTNRLFKLDQRNGGQQRKPKPITIQLNDNVEVNLLFSKHSNSKTFRIFREGDELPKVGRRRKRRAIPGGA